jgi:hypothetical protein
METEGDVTYELRDDVAWLGLNRPHKREPDGLFVESLMAALSQAGPEAATRLAELAAKKAAKVRSLGGAPGITSHCTAPMSERYPLRRSVPSSSMTWSLPPPMSPTARCWPTCARGRDTGMGRSGLPRPDRRDQRACARGPGLHPPPLSPPRGVVDEEERRKNRTKSSVRSKVERAIGVIKRVFGFAKVRYCGLDKNAHRLSPAPWPISSSSDTVSCVRWRSVPGVGQNRGINIQCGPSDRTNNIIL